MFRKIAVTTTLAAMLATPALAEEYGSGLYAKDCDNPYSGYDITIGKDGSATVQHKGEVYENVLTSYSFFGDNTPSGFVIAILFDDNNSPVPAYKGDSGRLEIWEADPDPVVRENGREDKEFYFCN